MVFCLLLSVHPANALFLAGQTEQGGVISILCEGQSRVFLSLPTGELRAIPLDSDFQARFLPTDSGPYTIQCGKETATMAVLLPKQTETGTYSSGENLFLAAGLVIAFLAALLIAASALLRPRTIFSKSAGNGRVALFLRAGEDLHGIEIIDLQGGEDGAPLRLSIPHLPAGASWNWEYECNSAEPLAASLSAKCANGLISIVSYLEGEGMPKQKGNMQEKRKLAKRPG